MAATAFTPLSLFSSANVNVDVVVVVVVGILSQPLRVSETASTAEARRVCVL